MKKHLLLLLAGACLSGAAHAQYSEFGGDNANDVASKFTLSSDANVLEIGGRVSGYYENRMLKDGYSNKKHNGFAFKDIDLDFYGKTARKFEYEIQLSMLDIITAASSGNTTTPSTVQAASNVQANPYNPGFKAAYLQYKGSVLRIKFGYDKLPYSQGSISDIWRTPNWSHANLFGGDLFSRRDLGVTLNSRLWKNRINVYAGAYSGLGENVFEYGGDGSGKLEYIARVEFSYPGKMKYSTIDAEIVQKPTFRVAVNVRYMDKKQPTGRVIADDIPDAAGPYGTRIFDGKRTCFGADAILKYKGFSATLEGHIIDMKPTSAADALYYGTPTSFNKSDVKAGGIVAGANYNWEKIKSVVSLNYENFNANDLVDGHEEWFYIGYAYKVGGFNSVLKAEYYIPLQEDKNLDPLKYKAQLRVGYQVVF